MSLYDINSNQHLNNFNNTKQKLNGHNNNNHNSINKYSNEKNIDNETLVKVFNAACNTIQNLPKNGSFQLSNEALLKFYGYFKQATDGPCNRPKPSMFKVVEKAKWDSWNSLKNLSKEEAMNAYIQEIKNIVETMPHNEYVGKFLEVLGPFYEYVDENENDSEDDEVTKASENNEIQVIQTNGGNDVDDEDNYEDTSDSLDSVQTIKSLKSKLNNTNNNNNNNDDFNGYLNTNGYCCTNGNGYDSETNNHNDNLNNLIINYGGESNTNYQQNRPTSRPNSTHSGPTQRFTGFNSGLSSNINNSGIGNDGAGGGGSNGGGDGPPNENFLNINYLQQDSNRQIILLLARLQQDTNSVLTRLSYLEATVMSIQNGLQLNRLESTLQANEQKKNALTTITSQSVTCSHFSIINYLLGLNIDWKTVFVALIAPMVIRLAFYFVKKLKLLLKLKRGKNLI